MHIFDVGIALFDCNFHEILHHLSDARILRKSSAILMHGCALLPIPRIVIVKLRFYRNSDARNYGKSFPSEALLMSETYNVYFTAISGLSRKLQQNYNRIAMGVLPGNIYSPRQASGSQDRTKISTTLRIQAAVGQGEIKFTANYYRLNGNYVYYLEYLVLLLVHLPATLR